MLVASHHSIMPFAKSLATLRAPANPTVHLWPCRKVTFPAKGKSVFGSLVLENKCAAVPARNRSLGIVALDETSAPTKGIVVLSAKRKTPLRLSTHLALQFFRNWFSVQFSVLGGSPTKLKVVNSVIERIFVFVMNYLARFQRPTQMARHDEPCPQYFPAFCTVWMFGKAKPFAFRDGERFHGSILNL